ncbi:MAG: protein kinase, partial [Longimicrobiales bacterium]
MPLEPGTRLGPYEILAPLGAGGMGEVYRATDTKLGRDVAIKVLPSEVAGAPERLARFEREAKLLASLNHPHIAAIYGLEEAQGQPFLVLELVEGEGLEQRLRRGAIPVEQGLAIARQIAEALEEAHGKGIVHRDLKPENVKLTPEGKVKVLDFGLARAYGREETEAPPEVLSQSPTEQRTATGVILGTAAYMSPEQARGHPVDKRTDIWAFGVVLFEMLTGQRLFGKETVSDTLAAVLEREVDWEALPETTPAGVQRVLRRCLQKDRDRRLHDMADARIEIEEALGEPPAAPPHAGPSVAMRPSWRRALPWGLVVLVLAALGWWALRDRAPAVAPGEITSLVVLPLDNLMNDPEQDYLVNGMHEALITELSKIGALAVVSRTSALAYKGRKKDKLVPEIADELGIDAVVEGSVLRVGDTVRVTVQLIEGRTDRHLWADSFDRELSDILALHSDVARAVAREIQVSITPEEEALLAKAGSVDPDAYDLYLRGRDARFTAESGESARLEEGLARAEQYFRMAIEKQPDFALAWAGLGETLFLTWAHRLRPRKAVEPEIREAAAKALSLDDTAPEVHITSALVHETLDGDWAAAEKDLLRALELDPRHWNAHREYAQLLRRVGRLDEALVEYQLVQERDPLSDLANFQLGRIHYLRREFEEALERFDAGPRPPLFLTTASLLATGATLDEVRNALEPWRD